MLLGEAVEFVGLFPPRGDGWLVCQGFGRRKRGKEIRNDGTLGGVEFTVPDEINGDLTGE